MRATGQSVYVHKVLTATRCRDHHAELPARGRELWKVVTLESWRMQLITTVISAVT